MRKQRRTRRNVSVGLALLFGVIATLLAVLDRGASGASTASGSAAYSAILRGANEVPPRRSSATATATVFLSADEKTITVDLSFAGLSSNAIGAHVHRGRLGVNGPVVFPLRGVP